MEKIMRNCFLFLSKNVNATKLAKKYGLKFGAQKFVAGETLEDAISSIKKLNKKGIVATIDHLGEFVSTKEEAKVSKEACLRALEAIKIEKTEANLSLKLTQLGLDQSEELCLENMKEIVKKANKLNLFVRIDMEDYKRNEKTIKIYEILRKKYPKNVGIVIQAYLYKSEKDIERLNTKHCNFRLCKGAYKESKEVAFPNKKDVDENYLKLIKTHIMNENYAAIATHDELIIEKVKTFIKDNQIKKSQFEFQMLYGIRTELQEKLANEGYKVRAYIPYGNDWYGYFMRRLAERPANVNFVLKSLFKK